LNDLKQGNGISLLLNNFALEYTIWSGRCEKIKIGGNAPASGLCWWY